MIVDDTPVNLSLLEQMLREKGGYRVPAFPSGGLALKAAAAKPPVLILFFADRAVNPHLAAYAQDSVDDIGGILRTVPTRRQHQDLGEIVLKSRNLQTDGLAAVLEGNGSARLVRGQDFIFGFFGDNLLGF